MVGPCVSDDLARTVNLFYGKKLSTEKLKERRLREMRPENVDLLMRTTNRTVFKLNCGDVRHARGTDIKLQHAEQNVVKATYPIIRAVEELQQLQQPALKPLLSSLQILSRILNSPGDNYTKVFSLRAGRVSWLSLKTPTVSCLAILKLG